MKTHLIIYDHTCMFCRRSVLEILKIDHKKIFLFASLDSEIAHHYLQQMTDTFNTLILVENSASVHPKIWIRGRAFFRIFWLEGGWWRLLGLFCYLPLVTDWLYRLVARLRHHLFKGKIDERELFEAHRDRFVH